MIFSNTSPLRPLTQRDSSSQNYLVLVLAKFDWPLIFSAVFILLLGLVALYSAGHNPDSEAYTVPLLGFNLHSRAFIKQIAFLVAGILPFSVGLFLSPRMLFRSSYLVYGAVICMLIAVALFGTVVNGSRRWLDFGSVHFQPAEVMKIAVVLCLARYLSMRPPMKGGYRLKQIIFPFLLILLPMGLIVTQPDLGTGLVVGAIGVAMLLFVGLRWQILAGMLIIAMVSAYPAWQKLHSYQKQRILVLFDSSLDPKGSGYHIAQSKIAVGSGGLSGKGYLSGTQSQLEFLPEHTTDFIFSVLAEEWGFLGCFVVLLAYFLFLLRLLFIASTLKDNFSCLVVYGVTFGYFFHTFVNIGMVTGILPVVGIPLPLFSYGGSSLWAALFSLGLALGVSVRKRL